MNPLHLTFFSQPKPDQLEQINTLKALLASREALNERWSSVLMNWLKRFEGFMSDLEGEENDFLLNDLNYLISKSSLDVTDDQLAELVATQHITCRLYVSHLNKLWQPTLENYHAFKTHHKMHNAHQVVVSKPIDANATLTWLLYHLNGVTHA